MSYRRTPKSPYWYTSHADPGDPTEITDILEIVTEFLADTACRRPSHAADKSRAKHLVAFLTGKTITRENVLAYREDRRLQGIGAGTINKEIGLLSSALEHQAAKHGWRLDNPCHGVRLREPPGRVRFLSDDERAALIQAARENQHAPWLAPFIRLALNTGMRKGELLNLEWQRVDLSGQTVYLTDKHTKTDRPRLVPLNQDALAAIRELRTHHQLTLPTAPWVFVNNNGQRIKDVRRSFKAACLAAGISDFTIHDERHDCASRLARAGESLYVIKALLGHETIQTTERYAHLAIDNIRRSVDKL